MFRDNSGRMGNLIRDTDHQDIEIIKMTITMITMMMIMRKIVITMMFRVLDRDSSGTIGFMELMLTIELVGAVK